MSDPYIPPALFVTWQDPTGRTIFPVGRLARLGAPAKGYEFAYLKAALEAQLYGFEAFLNFPKLDEVYRSSELPPFFQNRLMPRARPDFAAQLDQIGLADDASAEQILARTGGRRATDPYELFGEFEPTATEHEWETRFFVRSLRHLDLPQVIDRLAPAQPLFCMHDAQNPVDRSAIALRTEGSALAGYCPAYLVDELLPLLRKDPSAVRVSVERINPEPAPLQYRVQCHLRIRTEPGFHAYRSGRFEPISPNAIRLAAWAHVANVA